MGHGWLNQYSGKKNDVVLNLFKHLYEIGPMPFRKWYKVDATEVISLSDRLKEPYSRRRHRDITLRRVTTGAVPQGKMPNGGVDRVGEP